MEQLKTKRKITNKNSLLIIIGLFIMIVGSSILIYINFYNYKLDKLEEKSIEIFFEETITEDEESQIEETPKVEQEIIKIDYKAVLEIPKIHLKKGIVDKNSSYNNVDKNIYVVKETTFPNEQNVSHIILAAHSGNSYVSYFKNLKQLNIKDDIYFYYQNVKYIYEVVNKYEIPKTGTAVLKETNTSDITLITCISGTNKQVVLVGKLISKENY